MEAWKQRHHEASIAMDGREEKLDELYEEIEKDLQVGTPQRWEGGSTRWTGLRVDQTWVLLVYHLIK